MAEGRQGDTQMSLILKSYLLGHEAVVLKWMICFSLEAGQRSAYAHEFMRKGIWERYCPFHSTTQIANPLASCRRWSVVPSPKICLIREIPCRPTAMVS